MSQPKERAQINVNGTNYDIHTDKDLLTAIAEAESAAIGRIPVGSGTKQMSVVAMSGDATIGATGTLTIADGAITAVKLAAHLLATGTYGVSTYGNCYYG